MKKLILLSLIFIGLSVYQPSIIHAQGVGINSSGNNPDNSAMLDVSSTTKGTLITRMTSTQRDAITSPAQGLQIFNLTTNCFEFYANGFWQKMFCSCNAPSAPTAGTHTPTATQITWNWNAVSGATGYKFSTVNNYTTATDNGASTTYTQTGLSCNTSYNLFVWAYVGGCNSSATTLTQSTSAAITLDATAQVNGTFASTSTFTINTTSANEIILVGLNGGCCNPFSGSLSVTDAGTATLVTGINGGFSMDLYACVSTAMGSHTITVTWGGNWSSPQCMAYAASFAGFCSVPTVAANVQAVSILGTTSVSASITPAVANSCLFGDYYNFTNSSTIGTVTWTNNNLIQTDHLNTLYGYDGSIAAKQLTTTSAVTVTASDNVACGTTNGTILILAVVHP